FMASVLIRTVLIYGFLTLAMKLMGKRQLGELETGELISALLISEIAALPIDNPDIPLSSAIFPTLLIITLEILLSFIKNKSSRLKRAVDGEPTFIIYKGRLRQDVLRENRISINEVLSELRVMGVGDIADADYVILEQNGKLSVLQKNRDRMAHALIIDGEVNEATLRSLGYNREWLKKRLDELHCKKQDLFLMTVGDDGTINIIKEEK
ncbi:MAG: DUF421 domain-containing protein, partial [Clostridia bacterium]|nr:DUF421 domain-containing protein [Clostridia bacterium]